LNSFTNRSPNSVRRHKRHQAEAQVPIPLFDIVFHELDTRGGQEIFALLHDTRVNGPFDGSIQLIDVIVLGRAGEADIVEVYIIFRRGCF
jgi:hypothetical protein